MKAILALLLAAGCSACADRDPVVTEFAALTLRIPRNQEFTEIHVSDKDATARTVGRRSVSFEVCNEHGALAREATCDLHGKFGTWVLLNEPPADATFGLLKERPTQAERPDDVELLSLVDSRETRLGAASAAEESALLRVRSKVFGDEPQLSTTDRGWPIADCDQHPQGGIGCRFGFLIDGIPVVAQWVSPVDRKGVTQAQVWDVASDVDRRVRRLISGPVPKQS